MCRNCRFVKKIDFFRIYENINLKWRTLCFHSLSFIYFPKISFLVQDGRGYNFLSIVLRITFANTMVLLFALLWERMTELGRKQCKLDNRKCSVLFKSHNNTEICGYVGGFFHASVMNVTEFFFCLQLP